VRSKPEKYIEIESVGRSVLIRLVQPERRNPLSSEVICELENAINSVDILAGGQLVFTGSGDAFASGADLREISELTADKAAAFARQGQRLMRLIEDLSIPTVAAINGACFGGGLDLALACKKRIASPNAVFCHPGVSLGIITGWGGTQRLPRLIGESKALEMLLTAGRFGAEWALEAGLVDDIADDCLAAALSKSFL